MAVRTGQEFIDGLRDEREVWYRGERVDDVTSFHAFEQPIRSLAGLYDMQHDAEWRDVLVADGAEFGEPIGRAFEIPRTVEQLSLKRQAYIAWAQANCGMMGRSPDFLNVMMAALAAKRDFFAEGGEDRANAVVEYYRHVAKNDLFLTHALLDPQLDKGKLRTSNRTRVFVCAWWMKTPTALFSTVSSVSRPLRRLPTKFWYGLFHRHSSPKR